MALFEGVAAPSSVAPAADGTWNAVFEQEHEATAFVEACRTKTFRGANVNATLQSSRGEPVMVKAHRSRHTLNLSQPYAPEQFNPYAMYGGMYEVWSRTLMLWLTRFCSSLPLTVCRTILQ